MSSAGNTTLSTTVFDLVRCRIPCLLNRNPPHLPPPRRQWNHKRQSEGPMSRQEKAVFWFSYAPPNRRAPPVWAALCVMKFLISSPRQRLGGFVNRGHPSGGGHDPLSIMDAADVCLVDHLAAAGQPLAGDTVYHWRLHLPKIRGHDSEGHHGTPSPAHRNRGPALRGTHPARSSAEC